MEVKQPLAKLTPKQPSLAVYLFCTGFSFDQETQYAWTSVVGEEIALALNSCTLTPFLTQILETDAKPIYHEGGIHVDVIDCRRGRDGDPSLNPRTTQIFLRPCPGTLVADLENLGLDQSDPDLLLEAEEFLLKQIHPICLDNSPSKFTSLTQAYYNQKKFYLQPPSLSDSRSRFVAARKRINPRSSLLVPPKKKYKFDITTFLQKISLPHSGLVSLHQKKFQQQQMDLIKHVEKNIEPDAIPQPQKPFQHTLNVKISAKELLSSPPPPFENKKICFPRGTEWVVLEIIPKENGCYDGRLCFCFGSLGPDTSTGEVSERFSLGNAQGIPGEGHPQQKQIQRQAPPHQMQHSQISPAAQQPHRQSLSQQPPQPSNTGSMQHPIQQPIQQVPMNSQMPLQYPIMHPGQHPNQIQQPLQPIHHQNQHMGHLVQQAHFQQHHPQSPQPEIHHQHQHPPYSSQFMGGPNQTRMIQPLPGQQFSQHSNPANVHQHIMIPSSHPPTHPPTHSPILPQHMQNKPQINQGMNQMPPRAMNQHPRPQQPQPQNTMHQWGPHVQFNQHQQNQPGGNQPNQMMGNYFGQ